MKEPATQLRDTAASCVLPDTNVAQHTSMKRVGLASFVGSTIEFYISVPPSRRSRLRALR